MRIFAISGSPAAASSTASLVDLSLRMLGGHASRHLRLSTLDPAHLVAGDAKHPSIAEAIAGIEEADGVIIATPIYKASYSGLTKLFLDLLPQYGLAGKAVLPLATGGSPAHVLALDYALRPVLHSMGARHVVQSVFVGSAQAKVVAGVMTLGDDTRAMLDEAILHFREAIAPGRDALPMLGHPRPVRMTSCEPVRGAA